jgi:hypothetical protein
MADGVGVDPRMNANRPRGPVLDGLSLVDHDAVPLRVAQTLNEGLILLVVSGTACSPLPTLFAPDPGGGPLAAAQHEEGPGDGCRRMPGTASTAFSKSMSAEPPSAKRDP